MGDEDLPFLPGHNLRTRSTISSTRASANAASPRLSANYNDIQRIDSVGTLSLTDSHAPYGFVEGTHFQLLAASIILLNMVALSLETDHQDWPFWNAVNVLFLMCYVMEFGLRFAHAGWRGRWTIYELLVIAVGVVDLLCAVMMASSSALVRVLMISRVLRLYRVVRMHSQLHSFVLQLGSMYGTFTWIFGIIFLLCFVLSILLTRLLGHSFAASEDEEPTQAQVLFADIPSSLFALFQLCTADDWGRIAGPVVAMSSLWRIFFVAFITFMSWTNISLLTAVASETMITASKDRRSDEALLSEEQENQNLTNFIRQEFLFADDDGDGLLDKDEFVNLMSQPSMRTEMVAHGIDLRDRDLSRTWDAFDVDRSGQLTIDELVEGIASFMEELATKQLNNVGNSVKVWTRSMEVRTDEVQRGMETLADHQRDLKVFLLKRRELHQQFEVPTYDTEDESIHPSSSMQANRSLTPPQADSQSSSGTARSKSFFKGVIWQRQAS